MLSAATSAVRQSLPSTCAAALLASSSWRTAWSSGIRGYASEGSAVHEVQSTAEFNSVRKQIADDPNAVAIIDFTAKWCGPCKAIAPIYEQLAQQYPGVKFLKVDIDNEGLMEVVQEHGITGVPTFTMYKGPRKVENFTGARIDLLRKPKVAAEAHPLEPQQQQQQQHGIPLRLNGRAVSILWDLDNTAPSSLQLDLLPAVQELQVLLTRLGGCVSHTALYANPATCRRLGASLQQQLAAAGVQLVQVPLRNQAADMQLAADAYAFARQQQRQGCIVCVSGDTDFAPILSYVAGQGAVAISIMNSESLMLCARDGAEVAAGGNSIMQGAWCHQWWQQCVSALLAGKLDGSLPGLRGLCATRAIRQICRT
ncbi:hypothetical protein OEZ86_006954 [Tetradesmus obliquus]|nr:hypothetical protein OEZ86_006954 [Tetradesmus obliquus]